MFKKLVYDWLWKALEIVFVVVLGYGIFVLIEQTFAALWAIIGITLIFYFFSPLIKPYIDALRKKVYVKWTGIDEESF